MKVFVIFVGMAGTALGYVFLGGVAVGLGVVITALLLWAVS